MQNAQGVNPHTHVHPRDVVILVYLVAVFQSPDAFILGHY